MPVALSVVVPCHNEGRNIPELVDRLRVSLAGVVPSVEIIIVDDGSTDDTVGVLEHLPIRGMDVSWIRLSRNFGKESALLAGLEASRGEMIATIDGDLQHPPEVLSQMVALLADSGVDQVVGVRSRAGEGRVRRWTSRRYAALLSRVSDVQVPAGYGDFRVMTRRVKDAVIGLTETTRFNRGLFAWVGFPTLAFQYADAARSDSSSRWSPSQLMGYGIDGILSFSARPLRFLIAVGAASMGLFFVYVLAVLMRVVLFGVDAPGYATLIAAVFFVGGMQAFAAGVLGEYLGRIFLEVKRRPAYIVMDRRLGSTPE